MGFIILYVVGAASALFWSFMFLTNYKKYEQLVKAASDNYLLPDTLVVGMGIISSFKINCNKIGKGVKPKLAELYSRKYVDFYLLIHISSKLTYPLMLLPIGCFMGIITGEPIIAAAFILLGIFLSFYMDIKLNSLIEETHDEILLALPTVLTKLSLMVSVGTTFREAWKIAAESGDNKLCNEMRQTRKDIDNGASEQDAYIDLADRCRIQQIKKMVSIICQNLQKGNSELAFALKEIANDAWNEKKHIVKRMGENATTKLVIPMMIMFAGVMVMILVPIMGNMNL